MRAPPLSSSGLCKHGASVWARLYPPTAGQPSILWSRLPRRLSATRHLQLPGKQGRSFFPSKSSSWPSGSEKTAAKRVYRFQLIRPSGTSLLQTPLCEVALWIARSIQLLIDRELRHGVNSVVIAPSTTGSLRNFRAGPADREARCRKIWPRMASPEGDAGERPDPKVKRSTRRVAA